MTDKLLFLIYFTTPRDTREPFECPCGTVGKIGERGSFVKADLIRRSFVEACAARILGALSS
jgi:hypothetical protein